MRAPSSAPSRPALVPVPVAAPVSRKAPVERGLEEITSTPTVARARPEAVAAAVPLVRTPTVEHENPETPARNGRKLLSYAAATFACAAAVVLAVILFGGRGTPPVDVTALRGDVTLPPMTEPRAEADAPAPADADVTAAPADATPPPEPAVTDSAVSTAGQPAALTAEPTATSARREAEVPAPPPAARPVPDRPASERAATERPAAERPAAERPAAERPSPTPSSTRPPATAALPSRNAATTAGPDPGPSAVPTVRNGPPTVSTREAPPPVTPSRDAPAAVRDEAPQMPQGAPVPALNSGVAAPLSAASLPSPPPAPAAEANASSSPRATEAAPRVDPQAAVRATLGRYEAAYSGLDVSAARAVWPSVNQQALARAFDGLASQRVALDDCDVVVNGATARATCSGRAEWTPKVGGGQHRQNRRWAFELANTGGSWQIVRAETK